MVLFGGVAWFRGGVVVVSWWCRGGLGAGLPFGHVLRKRPGVFLVIERKRQTTKGKPGQLRNEPGPERQEQESEQAGLGKRAIRRSHHHDLGRHIESSDGPDRGLTALFSVLGRPAGNSRENGLSRS